MHIDLPSACNIASNCHAAEALLRLPGILVSYTVTQTSRFYQSFGGTPRHMAGMLADMLLVQYNLNATE